MSDFPTIPPVLPHNRATNRIGRDYYEVRKELATQILLADIRSRPRSTEAADVRNAVNAADLLLVELEK